MTIIKKIKRQVRRARVIFSATKLENKGRHHGITGDKRLVTIRGKKFIIKPSQEQHNAETKRRREFIKIITGKKFENRHGKLFTIKVSKRYLAKDTMHRIEPYYELPTVEDVIDPKPARITPHFMLNLHRKAKMHPEELKKLVSAAYEEFKQKLKEIEDPHSVIWAHERDILVDYENGKVVFRIVDF